MKRTDRILRRFKASTGAAYIETIVSVFVIMLVLAMGMTLLPLFMQKYQLDMAAEDIARMISVSGQTAPIDVDRIADDYNIILDDIIITMDLDEKKVDLSAGTVEKIQLADGFKVTLTTHRKVGIGGIISDIDVVLTSVAHGRSEVYWKELAV